MFSISDARIPDARWSCRNFFLTAVFALSGVAALAVDLPVAGAFTRWRQNLAYQGYFDLLGFFELFGHGLGVVLIALAMHQLDPRRRWAIPRVFCCALASGGAADLLKLLVIRFRPNSMAAPESVWATFHHWLPMLGGVSGQQSFPSAHTATAVGLAAALIWLYPQGRCLFILLAALVGFQRVASGAHYPSDVLIGAAVGCLISTLFLYFGLLPGWLDRLERRWRPAA